jgi:hypothetical protein
MKNNLLLIGIGISICQAACGQSLKESAVPAPVKNALEKTYPGSKGKWEKEDGNYECSFKKDNKSVSLVINSAGIVLETETEIVKADLPPAVITHIDANYAGKTIKEIAKIVDKDGVVSYEVAVKGKDLMFDSQGNFMKEIKD